MIKALYQGHANFIARGPDLEDDFDCGPHYSLQRELKITITRIQKTIFNLVCNTILGGESQKLS